MEICIIQQYKQCDYFENIRPVTGNLNRKTLKSNFIDDCVVEFIIS